MTVALLVSCREKSREDEKPGLLPGESISIKAELDKTTMYLGEDARLTITAVYREDVIVVFPALAEMLGELDIVDSGKTGPDLVSEGITEETRWYDLTTKVPGEYTVPGTTITYTDNEGKREYITGTMNLKIVRTVEDISKIKTLRDIKPSRRIPKNYSRLFIFLGCLIGGSVLVYSVYLIVRRRRRIRTMKAEPVPPNIRALEELKGVEDMGLLKEDRSEEFIVFVSSAVRSYIQERFSVPAEEMTTDEFLRGSEKGYYLTDECRSLIREFLERCDAVKFAAHSATVEECSAILEKAIEFIEKSY